MSLAVYFLPKSPTQEVVETKEITTEMKINQAISMVQSGENPMQGIMMLRDILKEEPDNIKVLYQLGLFSIQSNQLEKAVGRFEEVTQLNNPEYKDAWFYLGQCYAGLEKKEEAIAAYSEYNKRITNTEVKQRVELLIKQLSNS